MILAIIFSLISPFLQSLATASTERLPILESSLSVLEESCQLIVVKSRGWSEVDATICCFERFEPDEDWKQVAPTSRAVLGKGGFGWGIGLHGGPPEETMAPTKKEGDLRSPAGVFDIFEAFGYSTLEHPIHFRYERLTSTSEGVDDPLSRYYNRLVDSATTQDRDWKSSEKMLRADDLYRLGLVIQHNWQQYPSCGSCIFMHLWRGPGEGTAGCTAVAPSTMQAILDWIDVTKHPLLVQLPVLEYQRLQQAWHLP
jgi:D-alanyl-D-alanine dipeptidase